MFMQVAIKRVIYISVLITLIAQPSYLDAKMPKELRRWIVGITLRYQKLFERQETDDLVPTRSKQAPQAIHHVSPIFVIKCSGLVLFTIVVIMVGKKKMASDVPQIINDQKAHQAKKDREDNKKSPASPVRRSDHKDTLPQPSIEVTAPLAPTTPVVQPSSPVASTPSLPKSAQVSPQQVTPEKGVQIKQALKESPAKKVQESLNEFAQDAKKTALKIKSSKVVQSLSNVFNKKP